VIRPWAIVLAAGDGTRLQSLTRLGEANIPKQFCSLGNEPSMLAHALARASRVVGRERVVPVVAAGHRRWWEAEVAGLPRRNSIVQPMNRGTAAGILLPLLRVLERDPEATVAVFPSDHWIDRDDVFEDAVAEALVHVALHPQRLVLLGIAPDAADPGLGWIVPAAGAGHVRQVACFREKPARDEAAQLFACGALVNSFVFAAHADELLRLFAARLPALTERFVAHDLERERSLAGLYAQIEPSDFSRDVLEPRTEDLHVLPVPPCGWSDLGTPERLAECLARRRAEVPAKVSRVLVDLARQLDAERRRPEVTLPVARLGGALQ
jgi:mannose-1-phosphate guanylyltransferase